MCLNFGLFSSADIPIVQSSPEMFILCSYYELFACFTVYIISSNNHNYHQWYHIYITFISVHPARIFPSSRFALATMQFCGTLCLYLMRSNLSVALVCMTSDPDDNNTDVTPNFTSTMSTDLTYLQVNQVRIINIYPLPSSMQKLYWLKYPSLFAVWFFLNFQINHIIWKHWSF